MLGQHQFRGGIRWRTLSECALFELGVGVGVGVGVGQIITGRLFELVERQAARRYRRDMEYPLAADSVGQMTGIE